MQDFVSVLFQSRTQAHTWHLATTVYSEHKALQKYYEELPDLVDAIIEQYQGAYQVIVEYPNMYEPPKADALQEVTSIRDFIVANRSVVGPYTSLQNEVDALLSLVESTMYKLTFLD